MSSSRKDDEVVIYRPWITHPKTGKRVYPKNGTVFRIVVSRSQHERWRARRRGNRRRPKKPR